MTSRGSRRDLPVVACTAFAHRSHCPERLQGLECTFRTAGVSSPRIPNMCLRLYVYRRSPTDGAKPCTDSPTGSTIPLLSCLFLVSQWVSVISDGIGKGLHAFTSMLRTSCGYPVQHPGTSCGLASARSCSISNTRETWRQRAGERLNAQIVCSRI